VAVLIALAGCGAAPQNASSTPAEIKHAPMPAMLSSLTPATANTTSTQSDGASMPARSVYDAQPDFRGLGPLRFGMSAEQMREKWGNPLYGDAPANDPHACYYLRPRKDDYGLLLMVEGGKFVRVDMRNDSRIIAPGGGRVGMTADALRKLYAERMESTPNKYDPAAYTLRITPPHDDHARLVFETDAKGKVTSWRIGLPPQVDYVEGCS